MVVKYLTFLKLFLASNNQYILNLISNLLHPPHLAFEGALDMFGLQLREIPLCPIFNHCKFYFMNIYFDPHINYWYKSCSSNSKIKENPPKSDLIWYNYSISMLMQVLFIHYH